MIYDQKKYNTSVATIFFGIIASVAATWVFPDNPVTPFFIIAALTLVILEVYVVNKHIKQLEKEKKDEY